MVRFSVVFAAALVFSSAALAQHSSGGGNSGGGGGGGSHASTSGGASASHAASSSGSGSGSHSASGHTSAGTSTGSSSPSSHGSSTGFRSGSGFTSHSSAVVAGSHSNGAPARPATEAARADITRTIREPVSHPVQGKESGTSATKAVQPEKKTFLSFLRHPFRKSGGDLRRPICKDGPCKKRSALVAVESELHPPICKGKACKCPAGETPGTNGGCVAGPANPTCAVGQFWNGAACVLYADQCPPNEYWNGGSCVSRLDNCATINARAASLASEVRVTKSQMQNACINNSFGQECSELKQSYDGAVDRYRMLQNEAPVNCRTMLADPMSF